MLSRFEVMMHLRLKAVLENLGCEAEAGWHSSTWLAAGKYPAAVQGQLIHQQPLNFLYIHTVHSADSNWAVNIKYCIWCKLLISQDPVTELARLFWVHWSTTTLIQQQLMNLGLFTVMQLHW